MLNLEISRIFYEIADILEIKEVEWKPRAYRNAARSIESLTKDVKEIYKNEGLKGLQEIPGIGEALALKIEEYIKTGKIHEYEKLKSSMPKGFSELMNISGLGPKKIRKLYKELDIKNVSDLQKAIQKRKLENIYGFGEKTEENIFKSIELLKESKKRFLLGIAYPIATLVKEKLQKLKEVNQVEIAGSLRRMQETIGDVDILVTSTNHKKVIETFVKFPEVRRILAKGETRASVILEEDIQCDLRVVNKNQFGSALQYFTGSKDHSIALRKIAIKKGYKLSEYGLFKGKKVVASRTEKEIYNKLGFPYIEPELRENRGELIKKIPNIISYNEIKGDLHIHTKATDGTASILEMANAAKSLGHEYIAITDHSKSSAIVNGLSESQLLKQIEEIKNLNKKIKGIKILSGSEVNILKNGDLDYSDNILKKLDVVLIGIHNGFKMSKQDMTKRILNALDNENANILVHPTGRLLNQRAPYEVDLNKIFKFCSDKNKILEIDSSLDRLDLNDINIKRAIENRVKLVIDTDSHSVKSLNNIKYGIAQARRGWCTSKDIVNTLPLKEFLKKI
ncbi:MAG: DNA polymerase/3'-5' exonuclease PolX [Candidatus Nanoarchaeia archaeon]|nr:DNA polymerase/3'-5' exonuclease PolX [Candidatus Nanoarchaeia archaeon]MDD5587527.1 DNA polymerase/3'-5' exonuclease PolX [Candidatus Nanoarchaeia archaeon]